MFMRGLDTTGNGVDPDLANRTAANPNGTGNTGAAVGSREVEAIQEHEHVYQIACNPPPPSTPQTQPPTPPTPTVLGPYASPGQDPVGPILETAPAATSAIVLTAENPNVPDTTETRPINIAVYYLIKSRSRVRPRHHDCGDEAPDTAPDSY
jgi:hypothetical protein